MPVSWATIAAHAAPSPSLQGPYDALNSIFRAEPLRFVLLEALGLLRAPLFDSTSPASPLVQHCLVVGIDTEAWTRNTNEMTEIGIVVAEYKDGYSLSGQFGDYAEEVLKKMKYHHLRIWENAHLETNANWMRGAEGNRFGKSRFVTFAEARKILDEVFSQTIVSDDPKLTDHLQNQTLAYDYKQHGNIVAEIDTQQLVKQEKAWVHSIRANNDIGLDTLCREVFGFAHQDPHTALNDAARTVVCAVNLALRTWDNKYRTKSSMQEVALRVEQHSQDVFQSTWGTEVCCTRYGGRDHSNAQNQCEMVVHCNACERFDETWWFGHDSDREKHLGSHIEQFCHHVAEFNAWKRRMFDAARKTTVCHMVHHLHRILRQVGEVYGR